MSAFFGNHGERFVQAAGYTLVSTLHFVPRRYLCDRLSRFHPKLWPSRSGF
jgi:hypothetical protein